jgi:hypothetical protein
MVTVEGRGTEAEGIRTGAGALLASAMDAVQAINERCLRVLQRLARERMSEPPRLVGALTTELRELDPLVIPTIARQPFLFVDFAFGNPRALLNALTREPLPLRFPSPRGVFPTADATALARGALILAQTVCRHHPAHAGLFLGMLPQLLRHVASLRQPDVDRLAEESPHLLTVRWESRPDIWRALLSTGVSCDPGALAQFRMYGIQLIAGDLAQRTGRGSERH